MSTPLILHTTEKGEGTPLPLSLSGYPTDADGVPIHYRRVKAAKVGKWTHRGSGEEFTITPDRADEWIKNTKALSAAGVRPFIPGEHRDTFNAADNFGYVIDLERNGDDLYATLALYGDDALITAATNSRSIYVVSDAIDAKGKKYAGESIAHIALTPNPALPDLGGLVKIAASAGGTMTAKVFELSTSGSEPERSPIMKPETLTKLRAKLNLPDAKAVPDEEIAERAAALALAEPPADRTAEVTALSADKTRLETELTAAKAEAQRVTLELSATRPRTTDPEILRDRAENYVGKIEVMRDRGDIPAFIAEKLTARLKPESPSVLMLSASADLDNKRPIDFVLALFDGAKLGIQTQHGVTRAMPALKLAADGTGDPMSDERRHYVAQSMGIPQPKPTEVPLSA